jgi:hypothetical protein
MTPSLHIWYIATFCIIEAQLYDPFLNLCYGATFSFSLLHANSLRTSRNVLKLAYCSKIQRCRILHGWGTAVRPCSCMFKAQLHRYLSGIVKGPLHDSIPTPVVGFHFMFIVSQL